MSVVPVGKNSVSQRQVESPLPDVMGLGGAIAGLGGGVAMAIIAAILSVSIGHDMWYQPKVISSLVLGQQVLVDQGFAVGPVLVGTLIHLVVSTILGAIFGILTGRVLHLPSDFGVPLVAGLVYGLMIWLVAYFVVVPGIAPRLLEVYPPTFIIQNVVYGIVTGLLYGWLRPRPYHP
jgi:hypothetical protein